MPSEKYLRLILLSQALFLMIDKSSLGVTFNVSKKFTLFNLFPEDFKPEIKYRLWAEVKQFVTGYQN